jgi:competence protein ComEC
MNKLQQASTAIMRVAPLFPAAAGLIAGIVLDDSLRFPVLAYVSMFVVSCLPAILGTIRRTIGPLLIFVAAVSVGGTLHLQSARTVPVSSIEHYADASGRIARVRGTVVSEPQVLGDSPNPFAKWTYQGERTAFLVEAESIEGVEGEITVTGRIRVTINEAVLDLSENEKVEVFGWLFALTPPQNPGGFDWRSFQRRQGVVARMSCDHRLNVRRLGQDPRQRRWITWLRTTVRGLLTDDLATGTPEEVSLLEAMVLGHRSRFDRRLNEVFIRAGVIHFIAVSGTNVAILMSFVWSIGRLLRRTKRRCTWLMVLSIIIYALVADPRPPILRATVMGLLFCVALLLRRPQATLNWTSAATVILILFDPTTVFDAGFQLSFAAVLGVGYLAPALLRALVVGGLWFERVVLARRFAVQDRQLARAAATPSLGPGRHVRRLWQVVSKYVVLLVVAGVAAWLAGLPIVAAYFHRVQPWGAISSAIVFPLMSVVMILGVLKVAITAVSPGLASVVAVLLDVTDGWLVRIVEVFAALPGTDVTASAPPWWLVVTYYVFLVAFVFRFPHTPASESGRWGIRQFRTTQTALPPVWCLAALALLVLCSVAWCWPKGKHDQLRMTVLAVGRGSATVIELPDGQTILYDAGTSLPSDAGRNVVGPFLFHRGIRHIDRVYISHPNLDHFSGIPTVLDQIESDAVIINPCFEPKSSPRSPSRHLLALLSAGGRSLQVLDTSTTTWEYGGVGFELLSPQGDCDPQLSANETSTVLRLTYAGRSILLPGDIEERTQRALLERGDLHAEILLLPHHGSFRASTAAFIRAVAPLAAIRSSNERTQQTLSGLDAAIGDVPLYNTADLGAVEVFLDREGVHIATPCLVTK